MHAFVIYVCWNVCMGYVPTSVSHAYREVSVYCVTACSYDV